MKPFLTNGVVIIYEEDGKLYMDDKYIGENNGCFVGRLSKMHGFMTPSDYESLYGDGSEDD